MRDVRKALTRARLVGLRGRARRLEAPPEWRAESPARALSAGMRRPQPAGDRTESAAWREPCKRASRWGARRGSPTRGSPMTQRAMTQRVTDARSRVVGPAPRRRCSHPNARFNYRFRRGAVCVYSQSHARSRREWISHLKRGRASAQRNPERARARDDAPRRSCEPVVQGVQLSPMSSAWEQLWTPQPSDPHSPICASEPPQLRSSSQMGSTPSATADPRSAVPPVVKPS